MESCGSVCGTTETLGKIFLMCPLTKFVCDSSTYIHTMCTHIEHIGRTITDRRRNVTFVVERRARMLVLWIERSNVHSAR